MGAAGGFPAQGSDLLHRGLRLGCNAGPLAAAAGGPAGSQLQLQQQRQVRSRPPNREINHGLHLVQVELATVALVSGGRVVEAVAQDDFAGRERRADDFQHELRAAGVHQEQFGFRHHHFVGRMML